MVIGINEGVYILHKIFYEVGEFGVLLSAYSSNEGSQMLKL